jgi:hypothetical protein
MVMVAMWSKNLFKLFIIYYILIAYIIIIYRSLILTFGDILNGSREMTQDPSRVPFFSPEMPVGSTSGGIGVLEV